MRHAILGTLSSFLFVLNLLFWSTVFFPVAFLKLVSPASGLRKIFSRALDGTASLWISGNSLIFRLLHRTEWNISGTAGYSPKKSYLVITNHQSWVDIFVLQHIFRQKTPFLKFFIKKELIWVPILGAAWWALDFPFMKRHSKQFLTKHPERKGKDLETTRRYCKKFRESHVAVINFMEGTRFTKEKHKKQQSPYRHLLKPRAGGIGMVLNVMGDYLDSIIDVTIVYPDNTHPPSFWDLLSGRIPKIVLRARRLDIPRELCSLDYATDPAARKQIQAWVNRLWTETDRLIDTIISSSPTRSVM